jgi:hypothetical protein
VIKPYKLGCKYTKYLEGENKPFAAALGTSQDVMMSYMHKEQVLTHLSRVACEEI